MGWGAAVKNNKSYIVALIPVKRYELAALKQTFIYYSFRGCMYTSLILSNTVF